MAAEHGWERESVSDGFRERGRPRSSLRYVSRICCVFDGELAMFMCTAHRRWERRSSGVYIRHGAFVYEKRDLNLLRNLDILMATRQIFGRTSSSDIFCSVSAYNFSRCFYHIFPCSWIWFCDLLTSVFCAEISPKMMIAVTMAHDCCYHFKIDHLISTAKVPLEFIVDQCSPEDSNSKYTTQFGL